MLKEMESFMSFLQRVRIMGVLWGLAVAVAVPSIVSAQSSYVTDGGEYPPAGNLPGDQTYPAVALTPAGGYLAWEDNITDGDGLGISAIRLDSTLSPTLSTFRVNKQGAGDQENPQVTLLNGGGAAIVWQGGPQGFQHIYAGLYAADGTNINLTNDILVSTATNYYQVNPAVATLADGNIIVAWGSFGQDYSDGMQGVYAQILSPTGQLVGGEFLVNQTTLYNQRTPAVAAFPNGNFIVAWVTELQNSQAVFTSGNLTVSNGISQGGYNSVDIYARLYNSNGVALGNEFRVSTNTQVCADPAVAVASDGSFIITWCEKNTSNPNYSWDIYARQFATPASTNPVAVVNTQLYGDQYAPKISSLGTDYLIVWTSLGQDGSREGVFGQYLHGNGFPAGGEFQVNTTVLNAQKYQTVASDGVGRFLVVWSSFVGGIDSIDLYAQRYITTNQPLSAPAPPMVNALDYYLLSVAWAPLAGFNVDHWILFVDNSTTYTTTNTYWQNESVNGPYTNDYDASSTHTFQLAYVLTNGQQSPYSAAASGTTWGADRNNDGLPDNWETLYWGANKSSWPSSTTVLTAGNLRATALQVFDWGANPMNASTWLVLSVSHTQEGFFLNWNTAAGAIYQVQTSTNLQTWTNLGAPRFAPTTSDSLYLGLSPGGYYQIARLIN
jgi:hypothetical protein